MTEQEAPRRRLINKRTVLSILALAILAIVPFATAAALPSSTHAQPQLLQLAIQHPDELVSIIVQKTVRDGRVEELVTKLGGKITKDLYIINAFAAELKAGEVITVAKAEGVRWISLDAPVSHSGTLDTSNLASAYVRSVGADHLWSEGIQGQGVTVAVVDSGSCRSCEDLQTSRGSSRFLTDNTNNTEVGESESEDDGIDSFGHGTAIAGILGGNGQGSDGKYMGIAPAVKFVSVKVTDSKGSGRISDVLSGLQWVLRNKDRYNIRVVNFSLNSSQAQSYTIDPLDAAVEMLWFNKIVVVVSAGNNGAGTLFPPANDPFVITVGATDDKGTDDISDDSIASFSASGPTGNGFAKPDLVAPGRRLITIVPGYQNVFYQDHPGNRVGQSAQNEKFMRLSGTSFAAPVVSGAVALLLQSNPGLNPDQVKYRLMVTANKNWDGYDPVRAGAGYVDAYAAVHGDSDQTANTGLFPSKWLSAGSRGSAWDSVSWSSVSWSSVSWSSVSWSSVSWSSVSWSSVDWTGVVGTSVSWSDGPSRFSAAFSPN